MITTYLSSLASPDVQRYLLEHENDDEKLTALQQKDINGVPASILAGQLRGRRKAKIKLPTWYRSSGIIYPPSLSLEQSSSEATAIFKTSIIKNLMPLTHVAVDLTGGLGVDSYFFSKLFQTVHYVEPNQALLEIVQHNHHRLGAQNIIHHGRLAEEFISETTGLIDLAYIDPSRRDEQARKVYRLADCTPDITRLQSALFNASNYILLKASPLLDIQQGLREMNHIKKVFVVSVSNECKELLFLGVKDFAGTPLIEAVDLFGNGSVKNSFSFQFTDEQMAAVTYREPDHYLYEPNVAVLKAGAFKYIAEKFGLSKISANTHLYTSSHVVENFPGKVFRIDLLNPDSRQVMRLLPGAQANVISRNYPLTPEAIKKKWKLRDGGSAYFIGFSSFKNKHIALCTMVTNT